MPRSASAWFSALGCVFISSMAQAESAFGPSSDSSVQSIDPPQPRPPGDGVYGRFNGDVALEVGGGVEADLQANTFRPLATANFSIYQTLGLYTSYRQAVMPTDPLDRALSMGLDVSPLFLIRWPRSWETGAAVWDLTLDSLRASGGLLMTQPEGGAPFENVGAEMGLGFGLPIMGRANGLWLRARGQATKAEEWGASAWIWLSWQSFTRMGIIDVENP